MKNSPKKKLDARGRAKVRCAECGLYYHRLDPHLDREHGMTVDDYTTKHPGSETVSDWAKKVQAGQKTGKSVVVPSTEPKIQAKTEPTVNTVDPDAMGDKPFEIGVATLWERKNLEEQDQVWVPDHDEGFQIGPAEMERMEAVAVGLQDSDNVFLGGPTGCGKSSIVSLMAGITNQPMRRINCNGKMVPEQFVGTMTLETDDKGNSTTKWVDGILPQCMRRGYWLLVDEMDHAKQEVLSVMQQVLEEDHKLTIMDTGETLKAHPRFRIVATANTMGRGDETGLYDGTNSINEATLDRFGVVVDCDYPDSETEVRILVARTGVKEHLARKMVAVALDVRGALLQEQCYCTFSTRKLIRWAEKSQRFGADTDDEDKQIQATRKAGTYTVLNRLGKEDRAFVEGLIQRHIGGDDL